MARRRETVDQTRADELFPTLKAIAETKRKHDVGGTLGRSTEQLFKVELSYSLNLGLTELNTIRAATAAETDVMLDVFRILNIMGQLEADVVK